MSLSRIIKIGDGVTSQYSVNFPLGFLNRNDVTAYVRGEVDGSGEQIYRTINWIDDGLVEVTPPPAIGAQLVLERTVSKDTLVHDYGNGENLDEDSLDESNKQLMMALHEVADGRFDVLAADVDMGQNRVRNMADPVSPGDAVTLQYFNDKASIPALEAAVATATAKADTATAQAGIAVAAAGDSGASATAAAGFAATAENAVSEVASLIGTMPQENADSYGSNVTVDPADKGKLFYMNASAGAVTVTAPDSNDTVATVDEPWSFSVVKSKLDTSTNKVFVVPQGTDTIMGGTSYEISKSGAGAQFRLDESVTPHNWLVVEYGAASGDAEPLGVIKLFPAAIEPGYLTIDGSYFAVAAWPDLAAKVYVGNAQNATAPYFYRFADPALPNTTRNVAGPYVKLPTRAQVQPSTYGMPAFASGWFTGGAANTAIVNARGFASITRTTTGTYAFVFSTPRASANYVVEGTSESAAVACLPMTVVTGTQTVNGFTLSTAYPGQNLVDAPVIKINCVDITPTADAPFGILGIKATNTITVPVDTDVATILAETQAQNAKIAAINSGTWDYEEVISSWSNGAVVSRPHGLGVKPTDYQAVLKCKSTIYGIAVGTEIAVNAYDASSFALTHPDVDATNFKLAVGASGFAGLRRDTYAWSATNFNSTYFDLVFRAKKGTTVTGNGMTYAEIDAYLTSKATAAPDMEFTKPVTPFQQYVVPHGFGVEPREVKVFLRRLNTAGYGYAVGQMVDLSNFFYTQSGAASWGVTTLKDAANITLNVGNVLMPSNTAAFTSLNANSDPTNWDLVIRVYKTATINVGGGTPARFSASAPVSFNSHNTFAHGLGAVPWSFDAYLRVTAAFDDFEVGRLINLSHLRTTTDYNYTVTANATHISVNIGDSFIYIGDTGHYDNTIPPGNVELLVRAQA